MKTKHLVNELRILLNNSKPIRNYSQIEELVNIIDQSLDIQVKEEEIMAIIDNPIEFTEPTKAEIESFNEAVADFLEIEDAIFDNLTEEETAQLAPETTPPVKKTPAKPKAKK